MLDTSGIIDTISRKLCIKQKQTKGFRQVFYLLIALFCAQSANGENKLLYSQLETNSPTEEIYYSQRLHPESRLMNNFIDNPALIHLMIGRNRYFFVRELRREKNSERLSASLQHSTGKQKGDYLPFQGNEFYDSSVRFNGYSRTKKTTAFGNASFCRAEHKNYDWNSLRNPELYWPYIVSDSTGGNFRFEKYIVEGAYSFKLKQFNIGLSGEYKGDFAYRQNDPRIENISTWLSLKSGIAYAYKKHILSSSLNLVLHKQHMDLHHFRTGQFAGFFFEYGFGMFDYIHSPIFRSMKQVQHIHDYAINIAFNSNEEKALRFNLKAKYNYELMSTEENVNKLNLYQATKHTYNITANLLYDQPTWGVGLFTNFKLQEKGGQENLFERYVSKQVDGVNVYDYKKLGKQNRYQLQNIYGNIDLKLSYYFKRGSLALLGGGNYDTKRETYKIKNYEILNSCIIPQIGLELKSPLTASSDLMIRGNFGKRIALKHRYKVDIELERHTEFQHAFTPYAYYANEAKIIAIESTVTKNVSFGKIGFQAQLLYENGKRLSEVSYSKERYETTVPPLSRRTISLQPDVHNSLWLKCSLFVIL